MDTLNSPKLLAASADKTLLEKVKHTVQYYVASTFDGYCYSIMDDVQQHYSVLFTPDYPSDYQG